MATKKSGRKAGKPTKAKKRKASTKKKKPLLTASKNRKARVSITESLHSLPTIGLDELIAKSTRQVSIGSRVIFYLGAFLGAVVINALLVSALVLLSA